MGVDRNTSRLLWVRLRWVLFLFRDVFFSVFSFAFLFLVPGSDTPLAKMVTSPQLVRDMDWVDWCWPQDRKGEGQFPKVGAAVQSFSPTAQEDSTERRDLNECNAVAVSPGRDIYSRFCKVQHTKRC